MDKKIDKRIGNKKVRYKRIMLLGWVFVLLLIIAVVQWSFCPAFSEDPRNIFNEKAIVLFTLCFVLSGMSLEDKWLKRVIIVNVVLSMILNAASLLMPLILIVVLSVTPSYIGKRLKYRIKLQSKLQKPLIAALFLISITSNFFAAHTECVSMIEPTIRYEGFTIINPIHEYQGGITINGAFICKFINTDYSKVTINDLSTYNQKSGYCTIPEKPIEYNNTAFKLPHTIQSDGIFTISASNCAPTNSPPKKGENFDLEVVINYTKNIGGNISTHVERGTIHGQYE